MRAPPSPLPIPSPDSFPGGSGVSHSYIQLVQHLIERCLLFYMDRDECVKALAKYAQVKPVVTVTVWNELEKANKEFFVAYLRYRTRGQTRALNRILEESTVKFRAQKLDDCVEKDESYSRELTKGPLLPCLSAVEDQESYSKNPLSITKVKRSGNK